MQLLAHPSDPLPPRWPQRDAAPRRGLDELQPAAAAYPPETQYGWSPDAVPLSWRRTPQLQAPHLRPQRLPLSGYAFLPFGDLPTHLDFRNLVQHTFAELPDRVVLRGCPPGRAWELQQAGFQTVLAGQEAVLDLQAQLTQRRSLRELARRGRRHGQVLEAPRTPENRKRLQRLLRAYRHSREPQLRLLFRIHWEVGMRVFVFQDSQGEWIGALTLAPSCKGSYHTELLLRRANQPVGVMEALIAHIYEVLAQEGNRWFSLGEVPFNYPRELQPGLKARAIRLVGSSLQFAYNAQGLYAFKDKFRPLWTPVYVCARPHLSWLCLTDLFIQTRFLHLTLHRLTGLRL